MAMEIIKSKYNGQFLFLKCTGEFDLKEAKEIIEKQDKYFADGDIRDYIVTDRFDEEIEAVLGKPLYEVRNLYVFGDFNECDECDVQIEKEWHQNYIFNLLIERTYFSWEEAATENKIPTEERKDLEQCIRRLHLFCQLPKLYVLPFIHRGQIYCVKYIEGILKFKRLREIDGIEYMLEAININGKIIPFEECMGLPEYKFKKN